MICPARHLIRALLLWGLILLCPAVQAQTPGAVPQDWTAAAAHMQAGAPATALPHLEALVRDHPAEPTYRLELAFALFQLGRDLRAAYHFRQALGAGLSDQRQRSVAQFLDRIAARKRLSWRFSMAVVPATNAGKRTSASEITAAGLTFTLDPSARAQPATGLELGGGVTWTPVLGHRTKAVLSFDTLLRHYKEKPLRELHLNLRSGLRYTLKPDTHLEAGVLAGRQFRGGSAYADRRGVFAAYLTPLGARAYGRFGVQSYAETYPVFPDADGRRTLLEASVNYALTARSLLRVGGYALRTAADSPLQSGWKTGILLGGTYAFDGGLVTTLDLSLARDTRDGTGALSGVRRRDLSVGISASAYHSQIRLGPFTPVAKIGWEKTRSTRSINSFTNTSISIGLTSVF